MAMDQLPHSKAVPKRSKCYWRDYRYFLQQIERHLVSTTQTCYPYCHSQKKNPESFPNRCLIKPLCIWLRRTHTRQEAPHWHMIALKFQTSLLQWRRAPWRLSIDNTTNYLPIWYTIYIQGIIKKKERKGPPSGLHLELEILQQRPNMQKRRRPQVKPFIPTRASIIGQNICADSFSPYPQPLGTQGLPP